MSSFDRLFKLAKKTGDRLIVFDSATGDGFAAIPIDEYEDMVCNPRDITALSGDQLIEQINHDIGKWRESQEEEDDMLDMFGADEDLSDEDDDDWESAGDVLQHRYSKDQEEDLFGDAFGTPDTSFDGFDAPKKQHDLAFDFPSIREQGPFFHEEPLGEPQIEEIPRSIPPLEKPAEGVWEEEPLDEDPIFFEEPV